MFFLTVSSSTSIFIIFFKMLQLNISFLLFLFIFKQTLRLFSILVNLAFNSSDISEMSAICHKRFKYSPFIFPPSQFILQKILSRPTVNNLVEIVFFSNFYFICVLCSQIIAVVIIHILNKFDIIFINVLLL